MKIHTRTDYTFEIGDVVIGRSQFGSKYLWVRTARNAWTNVSDGSGRYSIDDAEMEENLRGGKTSNKWDYEGNVLAEHGVDIPVVDS